MRIEGLEDWNEHLRRAGVPIEFSTVATKQTSDEGSAESTEPSPVDVELHVLRRDLGASGGRVVMSMPVRVARLPSSRKQWRFLAEKPEATFFLADAVTPTVAEQLRSNGIMFADKRGNSFISADNILLDVRGRTGDARALAERSRGPLRERKPTASIFTPRRAQVSAMLLSYPVLLEASIRDIAEMASVSVGTASLTLDLLVESGFLGKTRNGYRIEEVEMLLDAWGHAYATGLGAAREVFRGAGEPERLGSLAPLGWVSGETAVPELVQGGRTAHLYVAGDGEAREVIRSARLRRDGTAGVVIRSAFWTQDAFSWLEYQQPSPGYRGGGALDAWERAPLAVIYADLIGSGDPRLSEVAQHIKQAIKERTDVRRF